MANGHGGYRPPTHPAPVSGPGALSRRTDGRQAVRDLPNAGYGENAAFRAAEQSAPMAQAPGAPALSLAPDTSGIVPLGAPTQRPSEPLTAGLSGGPGAGPSMPAQTAPQLTPDQRQRLISYLPALLFAASQPDASPSMRQFVRNLRGDLG